MNKQEINRQESADRNEARSTAHRTGNYRFDPFQNKEERVQRPNNCYGCSWELDPRRKVYRLKFQHKLCYPNHTPEESVQASA